MNRWVYKTSREYRFPWQEKTAVSKPWSSALNQLNIIAIITILQLILIPRFIINLDLLKSDLAHATKSC